MKITFILFFFCLFLAGCKVGPNYHTPEVPMPLEFIEAPLDRTEEVSDEDLVQWWSTFNDPFLDELLNRAITDNFDYRIALEQVHQARTQYWVQFTQILPEFDADATASHFRTSQSFTTANTSASSATGGVEPPSPIQNFYQAGVAAIWEIDLFGKLRRSADASYDLWEASVEELRAVKILILSEVVNNYAVICSFQTKEDIAKQVVRIDEELLALSKCRFEAGLSNEQEIESFLATFEADKAQLNLIQAALKQNIYSLATLLGTLPENLVEEFEEMRPIPRSEGKVPSSLPSQLLRRRPDICSAERQLAAATEQIGVAVADLFPSITLTGSSSSFAANPLQGANAGYSSNTLSKLFRPASSIWGIGALVTAPLFDFGKRTSAVEAQIAFRNQAYYSYQKSVIGALQETEIALATYFNEDDREKSLSAQVEATHRTLILTQDLYQAGLNDYSQVIEAKSIWLASLNTLTDSQQTLTTDLVAVYKALGGDW